MWSGSRADPSPVRRDRNYLRRTIDRVARRPGARAKLPGTAAASLMAVLGPSGSPTLGAWRDQSSGRLSQQRRGSSSPTAKRAAVQDVFGHPPFRGPGRSNRQGRSRRYGGWRNCQTGRRRLRTPCRAHVRCRTVTDNGNSCSSTNLALASTLSVLTPRIWTFFASYSWIRSRNPMPSTVHPPVLARG